MSDSRPYPHRDDHPDRPNILWVCTDSQRYGTLGCEGNPFVHTPNLDRLASRGTRFTHAFTQSPLCTPSRGCFLTGRYPITNRLRQNGQLCPPDLRPVTRDLRAHGYVNALVGKFHLNPCDARFALDAEWWKHDKAEWFRGAERRIDDGYDIFDWDHAGRQDDPTSAYHRWLRDRGVHEPVEKPRIDGDPVVLGGLPVEHHHTTWACGRAASLIEEFGKGPHPWQLSLNLFDPHFPFDPPPELLERYRGMLDELPLPVEASRDPQSQPIYRRGWAERDAGVSDERHRLRRAAYFAMVDLIDQQVGRLLDTLARTGQAERTLVIFMSDHGEMLGDHGLYKKGPALYDAALRVPLILSWPGKVAEGRVVGGLVEMTDLAPTLREAVGLDPDPAMQGRSIWPSLVAAEDAADEVGREDVYAEYLNANPDKGRGVYLTMVRTATHKLIRHHGGEPVGVDSGGELYDLVEDPQETVNRWDDADYAEARAGLLCRLSDRQAWTVDPMPPRIGAF